MLVREPYSSHRAENAKRHRKIEARAFFANVGGRKVDGYGFVGIAESGIHQGGLDPLAALTDRRVRHTDSDKVARIAARVHVHFDIDQMSFNAENSRTSSPVQGHAVELVGRRMDCSPEWRDYSTENFSRAS